MPPVAKNRLGADLARAIAADDRLDPGLVGWITENLGAIYTDLAETSTDAGMTHRFFATPPDGPADGECVQDQLLRVMGHDPRLRDAPHA
jgi:hypothetical protein